MPGPHPQSAARRFLGRLAFSLAQGALFGALVGGLVYFRVPRRVQEETGSSDRTLAQKLRLWLEGVELQTYDWRVRELARAAQPSDDVVVVAVDEEAVAHGRQSDDPTLAIQPWSRTLLGSLFEQAEREGASWVLLDFEHPDLSPRTCVAPEALGVSEQGSKREKGVLRADDEGYRRQLDARPGRSVLSFGWSGEPPPPVTPPVFPWLLLVGDRPAEPEARDLVRRVLADGRPAYVIPDGKRVRVYAGVLGDDEARTVAQQWNLKDAPELRQRPSSEGAGPDRYRFNAERLLVSLSEVRVEGLRPEGLLLARSLKPPVAPLLGERSAYGSGRLRPDSDGRIRAVPHLVNYPIDGTPHLLPSLALAAAMQRAGTRTLRYDGERLHIGDTLSVPMDETGFSLVQWDSPEAGRGSRGSLGRDLSAWRLVQNLTHRLSSQPPRHDNELKDKIVVLADTSSYTTNFRRTPIGERVPVAAIQGQALVDILQSKGIRRAERRFDLAATFACAFLGAFLALTLSGRFRSLMGALTYFASLAMAGAAYVYFCRHLFLSQQLWLAIVGPLGAMSAAFALTTVYAARTEREVKEFVSRLLGRYVAPDVVRRVRRDLTLMRPERRDMTVYFCDIDGFTKMSESLDPDSSVELLGEFFTEMTGVVRGNQGQVDKYMGDSLMAFWGAPVRTPQHASLACRSALKMRDALARRQKDWEERFGYTIEFRAGLASGQVVVGDMGSGHKSNYTATGAAVNLSWWLEGANRVYGTYVLVSEATASAASEGYVFREVDRVRLRGSQGGVRVFELLGQRGAVPAERMALLEVFLPAMTAYQERKFAEALELFASCVAKFNDTVSALYVTRCRQHVAWPPPADWDGLHEPRER